MPIWREIQARVEFLLPSDRYPEEDPSDLSPPPRRRPQMAPRMTGGQHRVLPVFDDGLHSAKSYRCAGGLVRECVGEMRVFGQRVVSVCRNPEPATRRSAPAHDRNLYMMALEIKRIVDHLYPQSPRASHRNFFPAAHPAAEWSPLIQALPPGKALRHQFAHRAVDARYRRGCGCAALVRTSRRALGFCKIQLLWGPRATLFEGVSRGFDLFCEPLRLVDVPGGQPVAAQIIVDVDHDLDSLL